ncbi:MAG: lipopolysaccharide heptosyltransferase I [Acidithiobacillus sp.]|nr:lipopolysaccharide heptosyltransferase I [Acidithiobacillus sp.]
MRVLLVRLSSLGDVLHTLPAITDLQRNGKDVELDWLIEPAFAPIARWHPGVREVLPFSLRSRQGGLGTLLGQLRELRRQLRTQRYDLVLDSQGLFKSALLARLAGTTVAGLSPRSAREPLATYLYGQRHAVPWGPTAIQRNRELFAQVFASPRPSGLADFGLQKQAVSWRAENLALAAGKDALPFVLGLHATSRAWQNKEWPLRHWITLAHSLADAGYDLALPAMGAREQERVATIAAAADNVRALPQMDLEGLGQVMLQARAFVGMDTGLSYLAAALGLAGVTLYGPTASEQENMPGSAQAILQSTENCAPCGSTRCRRIHQPEEPIPCQEGMQPTMVWERLAPLLERL